MRRTFVLAVISLLFAAIWPEPALSADPLVIVPLGQIREGLSVPTRIDVDAQGNLYVADARKRAVLRFDTSGELNASFSAVIPSGGGLAVTPDGRRLYIACGSAVAILGTVDGELLGQLGAGEGEFGAAGFIDLDDDGNVYVADTQARIVKVYNPQNEFAYQFGAPDTESGKFNSIFSLAVNPAVGEVYVADSLRSMISPPKMQVFDLAGQLLRTLHADTDFGPVLPIFGGMAFDDLGRGYFLDAACSEIRVLSLPDTFLLRYKNPGITFGRWVDAAYDQAGKRLYVASDNSRIEIFGVESATNPVPVNTQPGMPTVISPVAGSESPLSRPELIFQNATDADGDALTYEVRILKGDQVVVEYANLPEGTETTLVPVDVALEENTRYFWSAQAFDGRDASGWTPLQSFFVNAVQEPPASPTLAVPWENVSLNGEGELAWEAALDPDPGDTASYVVEISADRSFSVVLLEESIETTSVVLADLADYARLLDNQDYWWRVKAVDNHDLASEPSAAVSFLYDTTVLSVSANMPGAKVHLGGNHAFPGRFAGEAPMEIRDFPPGPCSVVVERSGFEPYVTQVRPELGENTEVHVELVPAIAPASLAARSIEADGRKIVLAGDASLFLVDFNNDGIIDLLTGDASGALTLFKGEAPKGEMVAFAAGKPLDLPLIHGAAPCVVDWNNDGRKDLLVGAGDGTIRLFLNTGTEDVPVFDEGCYLRGGADLIAVGAGAKPAVVDLDNDGAKDLVVGCVSGAVQFFRNTGSDDLPQLATASTLLSLSGPVAPFFADWDADGRRDLLLGTSTGIYLYGRQADGAFAAGEALLPGKSMSGQKGASGGWQLFALDLDSRKGKDLMVGDSAGKILMLSSNGMAPVAAFSEALLEKISQIDQQISESSPELKSLSVQVTEAVKAGNFRKALVFAKKLEASAPPETPLATAARELVELFGTLI